MQGQRAFSRRAMSRRDFLKLCGAGVVGTTLLGGCRESVSGGSSNFPTRPIEVIVAYEAGGGTDVGARILQPYVEDELGQSLNIVNKPGGGGWVGWGDLAQATPDGYTIGFINSPNFMTGYLNPELDIRHNLDSFSPIGNQVTDYGAIGINPEDERFSTIDELIEYAKQNRLTASSTGVGSDDHFSSLTLNDKFGTKFEAVHTEGAAANITSVLGENIDVLFANVGEMKPLHDDGRLKVVAVMSDREERSEYLPDVPTLSEAGYSGVYSWSSRGIAGPAGLDPGVKDVLVSAFKTAINKKGHLDKLAEQGLEVDYKAPDAYRKMLERDEERAKKLGEKYLW
jgi:tripartite-type tricarboxylate transporter receptor subunit TctC